MRRIYRDWAAGLTVSYAEGPLRVNNYVSYWVLRNNWYC